MSWLSAFAADFQQHWVTYVGIPMLAAFIGYVTKLLALEMMYRPVEFRGIPPYLGWQGVVPRKAEKMAGAAADLLVGRLITIEEIVSKLDPERMIQELEQPLQRVSEDLIREVGERFMPTLWAQLPEFARVRVVRRLQKEIPQLSVNLWRDVLQEPSRYFDAKQLLVSNMVKDKVLLNEIFRSIGHKEFIFFRNAGFWFGLILGFVQLACWLLWHKAWLIPAFGGLVGLISDWLALQMLFRPLNPVKFMGVTFQGKFISRQNEVAVDYATLIAKQLLTPANMVEHLMSGPFAEQLVDLLHRHVSQAADDQLGIARPLVLYALGSERYQEMRQLIVQRIIELIPEASKHVEAYAMDALDINDTIVRKMSLLTPVEFEGMLRPAFKEDEKTLVLCGAILGFIVGELQVQLML